MTFYKCVNDPFGYCSDRPKKLPKPSNPNPDEPYLQSGGQCSKNPVQCGSYVTNTQKIPGNPHKTNSKPPQVKKKGIKRKN